MHFRLKNRASVLAKFEDKMSQLCLSNGLPTAKRYRRGNSQHVRVSDACSALNGSTEVPTFVHLRNVVTDDTFSS